MRRCYARTVRPTTALAAALVVLADAAAEASASNLVLVCGKNLDVAMSPAGKRIAWVEIRANVVFGGFDFRRYSARVNGTGARQEASNGGRPFVAWASDTQIIREGVGPGFDGPLDGGLCVPAPQSETNGICIAGPRQLALDPAGRHLRHPSPAPNGRLLVATAYTFASSEIDDSIERPGAIALYDATSAAPVRGLTAGPGDSYPSFAPDGRSVAFQRGGGVWTLHTSGGKPKRVLRGARQPTWSP
jgi:WD40 repeat protein